MVLDALVKAVRTTGGIGVVGVYVPQDPQAATDGAKDGRIAFDYREAKPSVCRVRAPALWPGSAVSC